MCTGVTVFPASYKITVPSMQTERSASCSVYICHARGCALPRSSGQACRAASRTRRLGIMLQFFPFEILIKYKITEPETVFLWLHTFRFSLIFRSVRILSEAWYSPLASPSCLCILHLCSFVPFPLKVQYLLTCLPFVHVSCLQYGKRKRNSQFSFCSACLFFTLEGFLESEVSLADYIRTRHLN